MAVEGYLQNKLKEISFEVEELNNNLEKNKKEIEGHKKLIKETVEDAIKLLQPVFDARNNIAKTRKNNTALIELETKTTLVNFRREVQISLNRIQKEMQEGIDDYIDTRNSDFTSIIEENFNRMNEQIKDFFNKINKQVDLKMRLKTRK